jgi:hypothetical protein
VSLPPTGRADRVDEIILMLDPYHDRRTGYEFV